MKTFGAMPVKGFDYDPDIPGDYERAWTRLQAEADTTDAADAAEANDSMTDAGESIPLAELEAEAG